MKSRFLLITGLLLTCWLGMMLVHESGHILAALLSGGTVTRLEWPLWGFSRTDISPNPHPLLVAWSGPLFGATFPLALALLLRLARHRSFVAEVFSAYCLLANGAYLGAGSLDRIGDTGDILKYGSPLWLLWALAVPLTLGGLAQLHVLGPHLGVPSASKSQILLAATTGTLLLAANLLWHAFHA